MPASFLRWEPVSTLLSWRRPAADGALAQTVRAEVNLAANRVAWVRFERGGR